MLIRQFLLTIPAVIPHRNRTINSTSNIIPLSTTSLPFKSHHLSLSFCSQTSIRAKPLLNLTDAIGDETDPTQLTPAQGIHHGDDDATYMDFDDDAREQQYDKDPELADILNSCVKDPQKGRARVEERIKKKRNKILHTKTGSVTPIKVTFNKFDFSNSYIWFEFHYAPLPKDISLICDAIRCWHIVGRLGGCNSMNMQLSEEQINKKIPTYDEVEGANVTPTTFYNIGDFELQDNLARVWVDIGTIEPLLLDVLINALITISSDHVGIKQVVFGGSQFANWKENFNVEEAGCSVHKI